MRRLFAAEYAKNRNVTVTLSKLQEDFRVCDQCIVYVQILRDVNFAAFAVNVSSTKFKSSLEAQDVIISDSQK